MKQLLIVNQLLINLTNITILIAVRQRSRFASELSLNFLVPLLLPVLSPCKVKVLRYAVLHTLIATSEMSTVKFSQHPKICVLKALIKFH